MRPAPLRAALFAQSELLAAVRDFFAARNVIEVTTPALAPAGATDPAIASIGCDLASLGHRHYLHTSPEHAMKRLLAAGSGDIWQLARVFRDGELGRWHQPEFLLLEWYRTGFSDRALMDEVFALLETLFAARQLPLTRIDISYGDAFSEAFEIDPHTPSTAERDRLATALGDAGIDVPAGLEFNALLDLALSTVIVPRWPTATAIFLYDYPATQAALATIKSGPPVVAARFEVFVNGLELANGYQELTDAGEQRQRFERDADARRTAGLPAIPIDELLLAALATGLPECAGVALGIERLLALLSDAHSLQEVVPLAHG